MCQINWCLVKRRRSLDSHSPPPSPDPPALLPLSLSLSLSLSLPPLLSARPSWRAAETAILNLVGAPVVVRDVQVGPTPKHTMRTNEVDPPASSATASSPPPPPPLVLLPGYSAGAGFFFRNLLPLSRLGLPVLAADWLGTGLSGRPPFPLQATAPDGDATRVAAERFFLDALDKFCEAEGIGESRPRGKMVLCGHSLGGHLAAIFALEQPQHVQLLVLICPAGLPEQPPGWRDGLHARVVPFFHRRAGFSSRSLPIKKRGVTLIGRL